MKNIPLRSSAILSLCHVNIWHCMANTASFYWIFSSNLSPVLRLLSIFLCFGKKSPQLHCGLYYSRWVSFKVCELWCIDQEKLNGHINTSMSLLPIQLTWASLVFQLGIKIILLLREKVRMVILVKLWTPSLFNLTCNEVRIVLRGIFF